MATSVRLFWRSVPVVPYRACCSKLILIVGVLNGPWATIPSNGRVAGRRTYALTRYANNSNLPAAVHIGRRSELYHLQDEYEAGA